ncbi:MAG: hypothetical protein JSR77_01675 [Planctomycetes bacterium]|nr:hypothetical protein [Planctomycetota bacterium]
MTTDPLGKLENHASPIGPPEPESSSKCGLKCSILDKNGKARVTYSVPGGVPFTDTFNIARQKAVGEFCEAVRTRFPNVNVDELVSELALKAANIHASDKPTNLDSASPTNDRAALLAKFDAETEKLLEATDSDVLEDAEAMLQDPRLIDRIVNDIADVGVVGESELALTVYLMGVSRLLPKPMAAIVQGVTSSGKSYVPTKISLLFPSETLIVATDITPNALYYAQPGWLMHRYVIAGERSRLPDDERAEATRCIRELLERGEVSKLVAIRGSDGEMQSRLIHQFGPIAYIESTTVAKVFDEDMNRCLSLTTDESKAQTRNILKAQAARASSEGVAGTDAPARHHALQRLLRRVRVVIPFASRIAQLLPSHRLEARRAQPMIFGMISAVALLHQRQRSPAPLRHGDVIHAQISDYVIARRLLEGPMGVALGNQLPKAVVAFAERLDANFNGRVFDSNEAKAQDGVLNHKGKVNEYLGVLAEAGVVSCTDAPRGSKPARWQIVGDIPRSGTAQLPTVKEIEGTL